MRATKKHRKHYRLTEKRKAQLKNLGEGLMVMGITALLGMCPTAWIY